jgi:hypothetical protein
MTPSAFIDKLKKPTPGKLKAALEGSGELWEELKTAIASQHPPLTEEWAYSGKNYGWSLRLKQKKRAILYMTPYAGGFRVALAFGENAVHAAHASGLPQSTLNIIDNAPKYPEGRAIRLEITSRKDLLLVEKLAAIKMAKYDK